jgi:hypothetical protein
MTGHQPFCALVCKCSHRGRMIKSLEKPGLKHLRQSFVAVLQIFRGGLVELKCLRFAPLCSDSHAINVAFWPDQPG